MINFVILGGGWRSEFYLRIAAALPEVFSVAGVYVRREEQRNFIAQKYNVKTFGSIDELLNESFDFIVNCTSYATVSDLSIELADKGCFVLSETPALKAPCEGHAYEKIQVAEQYHQKGTYQAIKNLINSGVLGDIQHINMSIGHDYHAMSMFRFLFDDYTAPEKLCDFNFADNMLTSHGRQGEFEHTLRKTGQRVMLFKFGEKTGIYDFNGEQYFSPIRRDRLLIRGTKGEISNNIVRYFNDDGVLTEGELTLKTAGLLEGYYNDRIVFFDKILYDFPFKEARLSEEEIAIAQCLIGMKNYIETGEEFYSYQKAYEDYMFFNK